MYDKLIWKSDRMLLGELVFRLQHFRRDDWELGNECFIFYKTKQLVDQYARFWSARPDFAPQNIVELGVWDGGSLAFWFEVFRPAKLVGIDIQRKQASAYWRKYIERHALHARLKIFRGTDQSDSTALRRIVDREFDAPLDLVIDDASHLYGPTQAAFELLFPRVRPGGLYIIEDWAWGHWAEFHAPDHPWRHEKPLTELVHNFVAATGSASQIEPLIASLSVFQGFTVIERGGRELDGSAPFRLDDHIYPQSAAALEALPPMPAAGREVTASIVTRPDPNAAKLIAFYLPQYHPIPENSAWWGQGFTEWTNVTRGTPLYPGHPQPRLPADLGFYDLRVPEVRQAQADLARAHGVHGFCYYHYWFNGRRLLERPFEEVLASGQPDFPFCLCWANENWTRAWDGLDRDVLIEQHYGPDDDRQHLRSLAPVFRDPRYIRVEGRPLFLVYRISRLPDPRATADLWRAEARRLGLGELYLCIVESLRNDRLDPRAIGFDAAVEFQPDWLYLGEPVEELPDHNRIFDYATLCEQALAKPSVPYRRFPCVTPGWDNTARRRRDVTVFKDSTPALYETWLRTALGRAAAENPAEPVVFINAWNEWGEAAYLEPDQKWGRAYLEATRRAVESGPPRAPAVEAATPAPAQPAPVPRVSVCIPTYNGARFIGEALQSVLAQTFTDFEVVVIDDASTDDTLAVVQAVTDARVRCLQNPRRLGLVANWNRCLALARAPYICIFHQDDLMLPENLAEKVRLLDENPLVGLVHSNVYQVGPAQEFISDWWYFKPDPSEAGVKRGLDYYKRLISGVNLVCCPSVVARRECYARLGGFDPRLPFTSDWEMWLRIALFYDVAYLTAPLIKYRRHAGNATLNFSGAHDLEQGYRAKLIALEKHPERVPDAPALSAKIARDYATQAVEQAQASYRQGDFPAAQRYLALAVEAQGRLAQNGSSRRLASWFMEVVDQLLRQPPAAAPVLGAAGAPADSTRQPTRYQPVFRQVIDNLSGRDIADNIPFRKILQAIVFKAGAQPGLRWLNRFKQVGKRLLGG